MLIQATLTPENQFRYKTKTYEKNSSSFFLRDISHDLTFF